MTSVLKVSISISKMTNRIDLLQAQIQCAVGEFKQMLEMELVHAIRRRQDLLKRLK
jgi:hypothetical protein